MNGGRGDQSKKLLIRNITHTKNDTSLDIYIQTGNNLCRNQEFCSSSRHTPVPSLMVLSLWLRPLRQQRDQLTVCSGLESARPWKLETGYCTAVDHGMFGNP